MENLTVAFLSATVISASLIPILFRLDTVYQTSLLLGVLVSSILILVLSMRIYAEKNSVEAEELKRSALEISAIRRLAVAANLDDPRTYRSYAQKYSDILDKFSANHLERDYSEYRKKHPWEFDGDEQETRFSFRLPHLRNVVEKLVASGSLAAAGAATAALIAQTLGI